MDTPRRPASGTLHIVATPIGNLEDITLRALRVLRECDLVVAEDTRRTRRLLTAHGIARPMTSLPAFDEGRRLPAILAKLEARETLALCTDAGTPGVSDPGAALVRAALAEGHTVVPVPGASAVLAALAGSGMSADSFCFLGFLPRTPGKLRRTLERALEGEHTVAFFESPLRLARTLRLAGPVIGQRPVVVARELTKLHECFISGTADELAARLAAVPVRGECTILVGS
ncbi:MAG: 16S rRNA (cytidine(1402)-2'-O)-methyltransferase [Candidatus Dormibacteria bacterium]